MLRMSRKGGAARGVAVYYIAQRIILGLWRPETSATLCRSERPLRLSVFVPIGLAVNAESIPKALGDARARSRFSLLARARPDDERTGPARGGSEAPAPDRSE